MRALLREDVVASCLWTPVSGVGMYAWFPAKAKVNRRGRANGAVVRVPAAQAVESQGQECGGLRAPLWRRHARRVAKLDRCHGVSLDIQTSG